MESQFAVRFPEQQQDQLSILRDGERIRLVAEGLLFAVASCALYWLTRSASLDETDSVNLALGVANYDLSLHQPHPPGAPAFIFFAKLLHATGLGIPESLKLLACLGGGLLVGAWYCVVGAWFDRRIAFWFVFAVALVPGQWMTATKAMTDSFAAGLVAIVIALLGTRCFAQNFRGRLIWAAVIGALAIGVRPQMAAPVLVLLCVGAAMQRARLADLAWSIAAFAGVCLGWLAPAVVSQAMAQTNENGWLNYFYQIQAFRNEFLSVPSWSLAANELTPGLVAKHVIQHAGVMFYIASGFNVWYPQALNQTLSQIGSTMTPWVAEIREWSFSGTAFFALMLCGWLVTLLRPRRFTPDKRFWLIFIWAGVYVIITVYSAPPLTRFYVPLLPLVILGGVAGLISLERRGALAAMAVLCLIVNGVPLAAEQARRPAPPVRLLEAVTARTDQLDGATAHLFLDANVNRIAQWYTSDAYNVIHRERDRDTPLTADVVARLLESGPVYSNYRVVRRGSALEFEEIEEFSRSLRIWTRHNHVTLYRIALHTRP